MVIVINLSLSSQSFQQTKNILNPNILLQDRIEAANNNLRLMSL